MKHPRYLVLLAILLVSAGGTFVATDAWQSAKRGKPPTTSTQSAGGTLSAWLDLDPGVRGIVSELETAYRGERAALEAAVAVERGKLATLFESGDASDEAILAQVEQVIAASNALERRTATFLLAVRPHLTQEQQQRLLHHFAEGVREGGRYRWRHGRQRDDAAVEEGHGPSGPGRRRGRGGPPWSGGQRP